MSKNKKNSKSDVLKKLAAFRKRWEGHECVETPFGQILLGPKENGILKGERKGEKKKR